MSSRAILMVGFMALFSLALLTALTFEASSGNEPADVSLDMPAGTGAQTPVEPNLPGEGPGGGTIPETGTEAPTDSPVYDSEAHPISATTLTALEQAAEEPIDIELARLLEAIQQGFGESSIQIEPTLRPYAFRLAGRLNIRPENYRIRVSAPIEDLAIARAEILGRLFESAGVVSNRLTFTPRTGIHSLIADQG